jgi:hypothetical protein
MAIEYDSLINNHTLDLVHIPPRKNFLGCKWVYKKQFVAHGHIEKHKTWLVAK